MTSAEALRSAPSLLDHRPKVFFHTMGCAKNEVDSERMMRQVTSQGFLVTDDPEKADAIVINTCSFIRSATEESLDAIFEAAALPSVSQGHTLLVVAGCMPARFGDDLSEELTEADAFIPCSREDDLGSILKERIRFDDDGEQSAQAPAVFGTFAYVKISDGCDRRCSYCTIPDIRGPYHSFPYEEIRAEVARHCNDGAGEIVLIAQDTGRWGQDFDPADSLASLMARLAEEFPAIWFRVMYVQPEGVTDELLHAMASHDNICSYLDIPLQHVEQDILRAMNRRGDRASFEKLFERIFTAVPDMTLRTTLIAGFPGETEEQFESLLDFVADAPFDYIGVFPYSQEEGTVAAELSDQIDEDEKAERAQQVRDLADAVCARRIRNRIGNRLEILVEGIEEDGQVFGRAQCQAPEVDGVTYVPSGTVGGKETVTIIDTLLYEMEGE